MDEPYEVELDASDQDLLAMARDGDEDAGTELWIRHSEYGRAVASGLAPREDRDSINNKAWAHILHPANIEQGLDGFRPYLYLVIRAVSSFNQEVPDSYLSSAFASLPDQWREVLWYAHIESMKPTQISVLIGISAAEIPRLLHQARDGLRQEWAHLHAEDAAPGSTCRQVWESSYVRNLSRDQNTGWIENHMRTCRHCKNAHSDSLTVASHLREQVLPTITGPAGASRLRAYIDQNGGWVRATTDLPDEVDELFAPRSPVPAQQNPLKPVVPSGAVAQRARVRPLTVLLTILLLIVLVVVVVLTTRPHVIPTPTNTGVASSNGASTSITTIATVDTGPMNNLYPIVTGTTTPDVSVNIQIGNTDLRLVADDTGTWTTAGSTVEFTSLRGLITAGTDTETTMATTYYDIAPPPTVQVSSGATLTVTGLGNATVDVRVDGAPTTSVVLDDGGAAVDTLSLSEGTHFVQVRYTDQSRFGPSSAALPVAV